MLRIAGPRDGNVAELRERIEQVTHYGVFHAGQQFTDALKLGARGPEMVVVPHGGFRMGSPEGEDAATDVERPVHDVRFARGFAMSRTEVTVDQFRDFIRASGYRPTATRRGQALVYEERSGNFVRRSGIDWQSAYDGSRADGSLPVVLRQCARCAGLCRVAGKQSGQRYRLPSEAEFEYALRAGGIADATHGATVHRPRERQSHGCTGHVTERTTLERCLPSYADGYWGPAPVGQFQRQCIRSSRSRRQCQRVGRGLLA